MGDIAIKKDRNYWYESARTAIRRRLQGAALPEPELFAKNVILFVGDGLGMATLTAARILKGQRRDQSGEEEQLAWDQFPAVALARTYNNDAQIGESSACATALLCGVKANYETVGLDSTGRFNICYSSFSSRVPSILNWAQEQGKATGLVTNTRLTHATPAALYSHSASRYWEDDSKMPAASRRTCKDIARQLVEDQPGRNINVLFGGGRRHLISAMTHDPEEPEKEGRRLDGRNLIEDWLREKKRRGLQAEYIWNKKQLEYLNTRAVDHVLGMFAYSHLEFEADRDTEADPTLTEMTRVALQILLKSPHGFFLFVEGGRIDHAHHYNNAYRALDETLALESAVVEAISQVDPEETLLVFTADHSNVLTLGGLTTTRGNSILGMDTKVSDVDGKPYTTLLYGNGPGYSSPRTVPRGNSRDMVQGAAVPRTWSTHGGEDVPVFAMGPLASVLFSGTFDQSYIPHAIAYIACLGEYAKRCATIGHTKTVNTPAQACPAAPAVAAVMADDSATINQTYTFNKQISRKNKSFVNQAPLVTLLLLLMTTVIVT
ncbi:alkaline phosphatase-like isoform X2 [Periplaneta americana]|uniref:alkaline phosphatase-like isoform X2 n=1 Tax=Periplaneta americana TaxID=6978 RepID=UPI0037E8882F